MHTINLLYLITKLELGGAQKQLLSLIAHLRKERYNVFIFTAKEGLLIQDVLSIEGVTLRRSRCLERQINPLKDVLALIEIYWFIKRNKIEIVHTHSSKAGILGRWAARLAKVKIVIHTVHGWSFNEHQSFVLRRIFILLERISALFTDKIIVVSNYDKQRGLDNNIGDATKYHLIRYGINYAEFGIRDQNIRKELGIDANLVVGMISCFKPQKSPQDFIRLAFLVNQSMPGIKFLLVGDGVLRKNIERLICEFNLQEQVILTGWCRDIPRILSAIDVFVLTSLWEGLPISVLEAMAASRPVVATDTGGIKEVIVEEKTGFLVEPRNVKELSEKLAVLLNNKNLRTAIGQKAKDALGSNFSLSNTVNGNQDLYENLIREKGTGYVN